MRIASRTPEGEPQQCPVCGQIDRLWPSFPGGESCCPSCGSLLLVLRDHVRRKVGGVPDEFNLSTFFVDPDADSLNVVERAGILDDPAGGRRGFGGE